MSWDQLFDTNFFSGENGKMPFAMNMKEFKPVNEKSPANWKSLANIY